MDQIQILTKMMIILLSCSAAGAAAFHIKYKIMKRKLDNLNVAKKTRKALWFILEDSLVWRNQLLLSLLPEGVVLLILSCIS